MREKRRIPEQRDFLSWRNERRQWFTTAAEAIEETWALPEGSHLRVFAQPHPDGGLLVIFEDRTEQFRLASSCDTLLRVQAATPDRKRVVQGKSVSDRVYLGGCRYVNKQQTDKT